MEPWGAALYGNPCRECGFDWSITPQDAIAWVAAFDVRLAEATTDATGDRRRPSGGWSVTEYVAHIGDNLRQWAERVQGARLDGRIKIAGYDPDELATARRYSDLTLGAASWSACHAAALWVSALTAAVTEGVELHHATRGVQRAEDVARNNCHDAYHHLWDIQEIITS
jgi:DinB family protein